LRREIKIRGKMPYYFRLPRLLRLFCSVLYPRRHITSFCSVLLARPVLLRLVNVSVPLHSTSPPHSNISFIRHKSSIPSQPLTNLYFLRPAASPPAPPPEAATAPSPLDHSRKTKTTRRPNPSTPTHLSTPRLSHKKCPQSRVHRTPRI
jgi:hypothetical protein